MPYTPRQASIEDEGTKVDFRYECWKNEVTGEGIVSVEGNTEQDHQYLIDNRSDVAGAIQEQEKLSDMRYFENQHNGTHSEMNIERDENDNISQVLNHHSSLTSEELSKQGQKLLDKEHDHYMDLSANSLHPENEIKRNNKGIDPD